MPIPEVPCTPDHCGQTDVPMIFRSHSPRTCPGVRLPGHETCEAPDAQHCRTCGCCRDLWADDCECADETCGCFMYYGQDN